MIRYTYIACLDLLSPPWIRQARFGIRNINYYPVSFFSASSFRFIILFCPLSHILTYRMFNLKVNRILIWVIYLLRFTTCYITQLNFLYSESWRWCPFISIHLSTRFTMFLATFHSILSFFNHFRNSTFYWRLPSKFFKWNFVYSGRKTSFLNNFPK